MNERSSTSSSPVAAETQRVAIDLAAIDQLPVPTVLAAREHERVLLVYVDQHGRPVPLQRAPSYWGASFGELEYFARRMLAEGAGIQGAAGVVAIDASSGQVLLEVAHDD